MNYNNRNLTTHSFVNSHQSPFWSFIAREVSRDLQEDCMHSGRYQNIRVFSSKNTKGRHQMRVICTKCYFVFYNTMRCFDNGMLNYYGF